MTCASGGAARTSAPTAAGAASAGSEKLTPVGYEMLYTTAALPA